MNTVIKQSSKQSVARQIKSRVKFPALNAPNSTTTGDAGCDYISPDDGSQAPNAATAVTTSNCELQSCIITDNMGQWTASGAVECDDEPIADAPFPLHCFPDIVAEMGREIARVERVPESLPGCCILGLLSASIGAGLQIQSTHRLTRANLYLTPAAASGTGKTGTHLRLFRPYRQFEAEQLERWRTELLPELRKEKVKLEADISKLKKLISDEPAQRDHFCDVLDQKMEALDKNKTASKEPVFSVEDVTTERLETLLAENNECLASISSDAGRAIKNILGCNKGTTDESVYLKAFSGEQISVQRMGRAPVHLTNPCLTVLWLVQPDKLELLLAEPSLIDGGFIPRLLMCNTDCQPQHIIEGLEPIPDGVIVRYEQMVRDVLNSYRLAEKPITIKPTSEASGAMTAHYNRLVDRMRTDLRDVQIFVSRWSEQAWRISLVLHAALHPTDAGAHALALKTAQNAIAIADWFGQQQLAILSAGREAAQRAILDQVLGLLQNYPDGMTVREFQRRRIGRTAAETSQLLERLVADGYLICNVSQPQGGGHTRRLYLKAHK